MSSKLVVEKAFKYFPLRRSLVEILTFRPPRYVRAVDGVSFNVDEGEIFCLAGESGCGKTTTGRLIVRLLEFTGGRALYRPKKEILSEIPLQYVVEKQYVDLTAKLPRQVDKLLRRDIQIVFQDPYGSLNPRMRIYDILKEPLDIHGVGASEDEKRELVFRALEEVKLTPPEEFAERYPHMLSGGQRQRIGIARALILGPSLVVADEPVSMLDVSVRAEILQLMLDLKATRNLTYVFITHDLAVAAYICNRIGIMYLGTIVEKGPMDLIVNNPQHPYAKALIAAVPEPDPRNRFKVREVPIKGEVPSAANIPPGCRFHPRCPYAMDVCKTEPPPEVEIEKGHTVSCWLYAKR